MRQLLFLCTGNYYRSRFAEELFNHLARQQELEWKADSCGLDLSRGIFNIGPMSPASAIALQKMGIMLPEPPRFPRDLCENDLLASDRVIALKESEHRPLMAARFPTWADRIDYWHIHDLDLATASEALPEIEGLVKKLIDELR
jgi:protein-tyrosine phosphatase